MSEWLLDAVLKAVELNSWNALDSSEFKPGGTIQLEAPLTKLDDSELEQPAKTLPSLPGDGIKAMLTDCPQEVRQEIYRWLYGAYGCRIFRR